MKKYKKSFLFESTRQALSLKRCHFCGGNLILHLPAISQEEAEIRCLQCGRFADVRYEFLVKRGQRGSIGSIADIARNPKKIENKRKGKDITLAERESRLPRDPGNPQLGG